MERGLGQGHACPEEGFKDCIKGKWVNLNWDPSTLSDKSHDLEVTLLSL